MSWAISCASMFRITSEQRENLGWLFPRLRLQIRGGERPVPWLRCLPRRQGAVRLGQLGPEGRGGAQRPGAAGPRGASVNRDCGDPWAEIDICSVVPLSELRNPSASFPVVPFFLFFFGEGFPLNSTNQKEDALFFPPGHWASDLLEMCLSFLASSVVFRSELATLAAGVAKTKVHRPCWV